MSIDWLRKSLPNGLHDAELVSVRIDYASGEVVIHVNVEVSHPEDLQRSPDPSYRRAVVSFRDVQFVVIDPPRGSGCLKGVSGMDAGDGQPRTSALDLPVLVSGAFLCWFYIEKSNSFVRIAAQSVALEWIDEKSDFAPVSTEQN